MTFRSHHVARSRGAETGRTASGRSGGRRIKEKEGNVLYFKGVQIVKVYLIRP